MRKKMYGGIAAAVVLSLAVWWINGGGDGYAGDLERKIENVKVTDLCIETDPPAGSEFRGQLTVIDNGAPVGQRPIHAERWEYRKSPKDPWVKSDGPPKVTAYKLKALVTGMGKVRLKMQTATSGGATKTWEIGKFRHQKKKPTAVTEPVETPISIATMNTAIYSFPKGYRASSIETYHPIQNSGLESQIRSGTVELAGDGVVRTAAIRFAYGSKKQLKEEYDLDHWPTVWGTHQGYGDTEAVKWVWHYMSDERVENVEAKLSGSFKVTLLEPIVVSDKFEPKKPDTFVVCPNCDHKLKAYTDHTVSIRLSDGSLQSAVCPNDGTVPGCGVTIYRCSPSDTQHIEWHRERVCQESVGILGKTCGEAFRYCSLDADSRHQHSDRKASGRVFSPSEPRNWRAMKEALDQQRRSNEQSSSNSKRNGDEAK